MYALKVWKHNPSHAKSLFHPFSRFFLFHVFSGNKNQKRKKRESEGKAGVCEPSTRMNAEQAWAQSMRREHAIKIRMRVEL